MENFKPIEYSGGRPRQYLTFQSLSWERGMLGADGRPGLENLDGRPLHSQAGREDTGLQVCKLTLGSALF
jgi:hypothetical protein